MCKRMVDVAQLVEPRIVIPVVAGSSPVVHPDKYFNRAMPRFDFHRAVSSVGRAPDS